MLISEDYKFIFIHIPRTGGTSISTALKSYCRDANRNGNGRLWRLQKHDTASSVRDRLGGESWENAVKFAVVRNPFDHAVSRFKNNLENHVPGRIRRATLQEQIDGGMFEDKHLAALHGFRYHVLTCYPKFTPQWQFIHDSDGQLVVDHVLRHESLAEDFAKVCAAIGIEAELPHAHSTSNVDYRRYYDNGLRLAVTDLVQKDLEILGYDFDGPTTTG